jgi:hypothetical protein
VGLVIVAALLVAGCYDPALKDCTVSCAADTDCAHGQICASGGWCAAEGATCSALMVPVDASVTRPVDAPAATPDAMGNATLRVTVTNKGQVTIMGLGTCVSDNNGNPATTCTYSVVQGTKLTAMAMMGAGGKPFDKWTDLLCKTQGASCMFTVLPFTQIDAQFQ